jgi:hypothetical protein
VVPSRDEAANGAHFPPDLGRVIEAWDELPHAIKAGILALVEASACKPKGDLPGRLSK